jgi:hypothetical protein
MTASQPSHVQTHMKLNVGIIDVRLLADATVEKNESHAGKVVTRSYYQRNKHIFPASRWEVSQLIHQPFIYPCSTYTRFMILRKIMGSIQSLE